MAKTFLYIAPILSHKFRVKYPIHIQYFIRSIFIHTFPALLVDWTSLFFTSNIDQTIYVVVKD